MTKKAKILRWLISCIACVVMMFNTTSAFAFATDIESTNSADETFSDTQTFANYNTMDLGTFTFTGENNGAWKKVEGNYVRIRVAYKPIDGDYASVDLFMDLYQYPDVWRGGLTCRPYNVSTDSNGYFHFSSDFFKIEPTSSCRLIYKASSSGTEYIPRKVSIHVWYDYY